MPTGDAARDLGVNIRTLQLWVSQGLVKPDVYTPGGHMRWDVDRLREHLRERLEHTPAENPQAEA